jgi:hypothetical protein
MADNGSFRMRSEKTSIQTYAKVAGALLLLSMVGGFFGEFYVPSRLIVSRDAAATAKNIIEFNFLSSSEALII